ncbi:hypothetical protein [Rhodopirellula sallentina]|nr:hypothetical protein [Rhodopirellula sallentina]
MLVLLPLIVGCDGCRFNQGSEEDAEQLKQKLPDITSRPPQAYPMSRPDAGNNNQINGAVKPGHWISAEFTIRSNGEDRRGVVQSRAKVNRSRISLDDEIAAGLAEAEIPESIIVRRPAVLPKGQRRRLDTRLLVPTNGSRTFESVQFTGELISNDTAGRYGLQESRFAALQAQTYFFVILTDRPERFTRLQTSNWATPFRSEQEFAIKGDNYRIVIPPTQGVIPIAETALDWTSTAVLLWDDVPVNALTMGQRTAVLDWLHFGGTLIVNGPAGADSLADRAFRELMPIASDGVEELDTDAAKTFLRSHNVDTDLSVAYATSAVEQNQGQVAVSGEKRPDAMEVGEGGLLAEKRAGRGRVVQCRVDLMSEWLTSWQSYDSFFNSAVLARPPRVFSLSEPTAFMNSISSTTDSQPDDAEGSANPTEDALDELATLPPVRQTFVGVESEAVSPSINTSVRFFSRDSRMPGRVVDNIAADTPAADKADPDTEEPQDAVADHPAAPDDQPGEITDGSNTTVDTNAIASLAPWISADVWAHPVTGLGGWKNDSPMVAWGREQLQQEIGLSIPDSALVFRSLLIYLLVLIPINYVVFRLLGRLEWAWLAVVPLAILGALWVARAAQLDVGFARSRNELAMLELPKDYSRGHLTRVIGLYNSLASRYRVDFATADAAIEVVRLRGSDKDNEANLFGQTDPEMQFGFENGPSLNNISVGSNSYGVLHTEQIIDIDGPIGIQDVAPENQSDIENDGSIDRKYLTNDSSLELLDVIVVQRDAEGTIRLASLGTLSSGSRQQIRLNPASNLVIPDGLPMGLTEWIQRLLSPGIIPPNSARLIARVETPLGELSITPDCKQVRSQTLVFAHLAMPPRPPALHDVNLVRDLIRPRQ